MRLSDRVTAIIGRFVPRTRHGRNMNVEAELRTTSGGQHIRAYRSLISPASRYEASLRSRRPNFCGVQPITCCLDSDTAPDQPAGSQRPTQLFISNLLPPRAIQASSYEESQASHLMRLTQPWHAIRTYIQTLGFDVLMHLRAHLAFRTQGLDRTLVRRHDSQGLYVGCRDR
ncbi:hypothetical protein OH77DRAFT_500086 [Trametes cingulata]|nr:hypothetical protein OH77DRAFT_500086 [Trametes cingulata]